MVQAHDCGQPFSNLDGSAILPIMTIRRSIPNVHGCQTAHLAENLLLTSLGSNGLSQQLADLAGVEVVDEAPDARFAEPGQTLHD